MMCIITFFINKSPQIANPQVLGLIPKSQIRKLLGCASQLSKNLQTYIVNPQIANPQPKSRLCTLFYCMYELGPQIQFAYELGPQIQFAEGSQI